MNECSICLNDEIEDFNKSTNNCGHSFCKSCLDIWLNKGNDNCPICRQKIEYFEYRNEKYRLLYISKIIKSPSITHTVFRNNPNLIIMLRFSGLILTVGLLLQCYYVYNLHRENSDLKNNYENRIDIYENIINNVKKVKILNGYERYIECLVPRYFLNKCFNT